MGRLFFVVAVLGGLAGAVLVRLFFLQVSHADEYRQAANRQHAVSFLSSPSRGDIFFEDKDGILVPAAVTQRTYTLEGNPQMIADPATAYTALSSVFILDEEEFLKRAGTADSSYELFLRDITEESAEAFTGKNIPGVWLREEEKRVYPQALSASHALGFVGYAEDKRMGRYGVEQQYNDVLGGREGSYTGERSAGGFFLPFTGSGSIRKKDGAHVVLTVDPYIQSAAHQLMGKVAEAWSASSASVIVVSPKTGAILAMESVPSFNPNEYETVEDYTFFLNPFTQKVYEMGSIVKPLTMAAGLDARAITENTTYYDTGTITIGDATIGNYDNKSRGWQSMYDILDQSLNTGSVFIEQQLGPRLFRDYFERYGLGGTTGVDLPREIPGNLRNLEIGGKIEYATASYGQGIAVTPLGLTMALSAVANGGVLMQPYIVQRVFDGDAVLEEKTAVSRRRVLHAETSEIVSRMLSDVVDNTLAGGSVAMPGYRIAAKTGTAQIPNKETSGYSDYYLHTFFGYAPAFDPEFLILLFLEKPYGARYASQTLAEPFRELTEFIIRYYEIPPDK